MGESIGRPGEPVEGALLGWDIGGVNTKAVRWPDLASISAPYEIQHDPAALAPTLRRLALALAGPRAHAHGVTMTAELSQAFRTKRQGVAFVLGAVGQAFPGEPVLVYTVGGEFLPPDTARTRPLEVAASNWAATARLVARSAPDCLLVDVGTTTTDLIPIRGGRVLAAGSTDPGRLRTGELVYTGALRTPAEAVTATVPLDGEPCAVSAEGFALIGDAHLWLGRLGAEDYSVRPPDGRPASREFAGERLARVVCADRELLDDAAIEAIARALAEAQVATITGAMRRVLARHPALDTAVVTGLGDWIGAEAAVRAGLGVVRLSARLGAAARMAPAAAVACFLAEAYGGAAR